MTTHGPLVAGVGVGIPGVVHEGRVLQAHLQGVVTRTVRGRRDGRRADEMAVDALGVAVGSAVNLLDLELVVVGGGPAASWVRIWQTGSPRLPGPG
jgi:predicted NBD/HSP70 family sugar kinase